MLEPWQKIHETEVQVGYRKILRKLFRLPNQQESIYDIGNDGDVVCILALTPSQEVILVRQYRPGPEQILLELPGGFIESHHTPLQAAREELLQETGFTGDFTFISTRPFSGYSNRTYYSFVATGCERIQEPAPDPEEFLEVTLLSLSAFREHLRFGQLTDTVTGYVGLDALGLL